MNTQAGFSAVELLITLFIAAVFITTGYQLYSVVIKKGSETNQRAIASGIAYENLRRYMPQATSPCTSATPSPTPSIPAGTLPSSSITVTFDCPYGASGATGSITRLTVSVKYAVPQQEVVHAIFITP